MEKDTKVERKFLIFAAEFKKIEQYKRIMRRISSYLGVMFAICIIMTGCGGGKSDSSTQPIKVKVQEMKLSTVKGTQGFSGTVEEVIGSALSFTVSGTLQQISVEAGQRVQKGQLIASLDETTLRNTYESAQATLAQAEDVYGRRKQLYDKGSLPEMQWVEVQNQLKQARSAEQIARKNLNDCRLYAPFSGVIAEKSVDAGQNVLPGMQVVKLVAVNQVKVKIAVPEKEVASVKIGQPVEIEVSVLGGKTYTGSVVEKGIAANPASRSYEVKALFDNPEGELMPGMICEMHLEKGAESEAFILPATIIQLDNDNRCFVWLNNNGRAQKQYVEPGVLTAKGVVITSGLSAGDEVLVEGQQKVSENMSIEITGK